MTYKIKLQSNPNNELRITLYPVRSNAKRVGEDSADLLPSPSPELLPDGESSESDSSPSPSLDIRSEFKTVCSAMASKRTEFGHYAKTRIMRSAGALDRNDAAPWRYLFFTATLPGNTEWAKWAIADQAPWIINVFKAWLSKRVKSRYEFYVWEHQDRGALHFHYCVYCPEKAVREKLIAEFRLEWMRILEGVESRTGVNVWGRHQHLSPTAKYCILQTLVQEVDKSVAAYMAGYCGLKKDKHSKDNAIPYYPKRWYGVSRHLSALVSSTSEEEVIDYPNYRAAKLAFDEFNHEFEQEEIKGKIWCHTVGRGETGVHYHPPETQALLWQARKIMQYKLPNYPNTSSLIAAILRISLMHSDLMRSSQLYREICSKKPLEALQDGLYQDSLRRGTLRECQLIAVETLSLALCSQLNLPRSLNQLSTELLRTTKAISANHHLFRWNRYGYLNTLEDFICPVDKLVYVCESGTSCEGEGEAISPDSHLCHVHGGPKEVNQSEQLRFI